MNRLYTLKTLIDLFFFFAAFAMIAAVFIVPMVWFTDFDLPMKVRGQEISTMDTAAKILITFAAAGAICFVYAIYFLRDTINFFIERKIFHPKVIVNLYRIGVYIIVSSLLTNLPLFFYNVIKRENLNIEFGASGFDSLILSVSLGLFFIVLSEVFKMGLQMKEENELTV